VTSDAVGMVLAGGEGTLFMLSAPGSLTSFVVSLVAVANILTAAADNGQT